MLLSSLSIFSAPGRDSKGAHILSYAYHPDISINGDSGFTNASGVVWGSGTSSDPYIIEGWDISVFQIYGIIVTGTTAYFTIRDCYIHHGGSHHYGIYLNGVSNATINNNTCLGYYAGIFLGSSNNNTLINNNCPDNSEGICIAYSSGNTLSDNNCSDNGVDGIYLYESNNSVVSGNDCSHNGRGGIYFESSSNCSLSGNQMRNNSAYGLWIQSGSGITIWNNTFIGNNGANETFYASHIQAFDGGTNNFWNSSGSPHGYGNRWNDWMSPDADKDGIVDKPYTIWGSAGTKDYYPQIIPPIAASSDLVFPILLTAMTVIASVIIVTFIFLRKRKGEKVEHPLLIDESNNIKGINNQNRIPSKGFHMEDERRIGLIPRVIVQGMMGPKEYGILVTNKRSILVLETSSGTTIGAVLGGAVGAAIAGALSEKKETDYMNSLPSELAHVKGNLVIRHANISKMELKKGLSGFKLRFEVTKDGDTAKVEALLSLPGELAKQKKAEGMKTKEAMSEYAEKIRRIYEQALSPEILQRVEWKW